jgi:hypothetical protein
MATIRREDKEIIHNLSLLGMLFGAIIGGFLTLHFHKQAHLRRDAETVVAQTQSSLVRLTSNLTAQEVSVAQAAIGQVQPDVRPDAEEVREEKSLWIGLSEWSLWGICAGTALIGGGVGYLSLWGAGWLGSVLTYWLIRIIYHLIRKTSPDCPAARRNTSPTATAKTFQRDQNRLLPTLIKLVMLLVMALSVLAVVVWNLTAL